MERCFVAFSYTFRELMGYAEPDAAPAPVSTGESYKFLSCKRANESKLHVLATFVNV